MPVIMMVLMSVLATSFSLTPAGLAGDIDTGCAAPRFS